jgi:Tol biopolymer transport system component
VARRRRWQLHLGWIFAAAAVLALAVVTFILVSQPQPENRVTRFVIPVPDGMLNTSWPRLSPDGTMLAFLGRDSTSIIRIYVRPMNALNAYALPGTENASRPFWSPDSKYLAFFSGPQLKKIPSQGGPAQLISEIAGGADGTWGTAGVIIVDGGPGDSLRQISAGGGSVTAATAIRRELGEQYHAWPCFLPDGEHFLYLAYGDSLSRMRQGQALRVASLDGKLDREIGRVFSRVEVTKDGHLIHCRDGVLYETRIDLKELVLKGEPIPIAENVAASGELAHFGVSELGQLVFRTGTLNAANRKLTWFDRSGKELGTEGELATYEDVALSPNGSFLAFGMGDAVNQSSNIWVRDLRRGVSSRLTFEEGIEIWPVWSPEGSRVLYAQNTNGVYAVSDQQANGVGESRLVFSIKGKNCLPSHWAADGKSFVVTVWEGPLDIMLVNADDPADTSWLLKSPAYEFLGVLSPNLRYLAYSSNETGQQEIFVRDLSPRGGKWQISADSGYYARWRSDGKELIYCTRSFDFKSVDVNTSGAHFEAGRPIKLFNQRFATTNVAGFRWDMTADGQKFIINVPQTTESVSEFVVVLNWTEELITDSSPRLPTR